MLKKTHLCMTYLKRERKEEETKLITIDIYNTLLKNETKLLINFCCLINICSLLSYPSGAHVSSLQIYEFPIVLQIFAGKCSFNV